MAELKGWKDIPIAGVIDKPATAREYNTGSWRVLRPVYYPEKCVHCMLCWLYCPDMSIVFKIDENGKPKMEGIDMFYCKGCGTCAAVCPTKAIEMKPESEFIE